MLWHRLLLIPIFKPFTFFQVLSTFDDCLPMSAEVIGVIFFWEPETNWVFPAKWLAVAFGKIRLLLFHKQRLDSVTHFYSSQRMLVADWTCNVLDTPLMKTLNIGFQSPWPQCILNLNHTVIACFGIWGLCGLNNIIIRPVRHKNRNCSSLANHWVRCENSSVKKLGLQH